MAVTPVEMKHWSDMKLIDELLDDLTDGEVIRVVIGLHWTAVLVETNGQRRCGLASTLPDQCGFHGDPNPLKAGTLDTGSGRELARLARSAPGPQASVGVAAINALLPSSDHDRFDSNAEEVLAVLGAGRTVALVGEFPFVPRLRDRVGRLLVIDRAREDDVHPAASAPDILPGADVVALTGMTLVNGTLERLLELCRPDATVVILGPSTPLCPVLFRHGADVLFGSVVTDSVNVMKVIEQGGKFRQVRRAGVRLVCRDRAGSTSPRTLAAAVGDRSRGAEGERDER